LNALGLVSQAAPVNREMVQYQDLAFEVLQRAVRDVENWVLRNARNPESYISPSDHDAAAFLYGGVRGELESEGLELWLQLAGVSQERWDEAVDRAVGPAPVLMLRLPVFDPGVSKRTLQRREASFRCKVVA
jgi:hypothetical protein